MEAYSAALTRNGFFGPDSWYVNGVRNIAFAKRQQFFPHQVLPFIVQELSADIAPPHSAIIKLRFIYSVL